MQKQAKAVCIDRRRGKERQRNLNYMEQFDTAERDDKDSKAKFNKNHSIKFMNLERILRKWKRMAGMSAVKEKIAKAIRQAAEERSAGILEKPHSAKKKYMPVVKRKESGSSNPKRRM